MPRIGFIGLGHMGTPMAHNLLKAGHTVTVFDLNTNAVKNLVKEGAIGADTLSDITRDNDTVFTMLQTGKQVQEVCLGENGLFHSAKPHTLYIDSSSIDVATTRHLHAEAKKRQIAMIDAPVSGGVMGAEKASLTFMVGGDETIYTQAKSLLENLGKKIVHAGPAGNGQAAKICNNMLLAISMIGTAEAFALGKKLGLSPQQFFEISANASGQCWSMTNYCPEPGIVDNVPANNGYKPGFTANMMLKDLRLSQEAATQINATTPLGSEATALYSSFVNGGFGELDFSGIIKMIAGEKK